MKKLGFILLMALALTACSQKNAEEKALKKQIEQVEEEGERTVKRIQELTNEHPDEVIMDIPEVQQLLHRLEDLFVQKQELERQLQMLKSAPRK